MRSFAILMSLVLCSCASTPYCPPPIKPAAPPNVMPVSLASLCERVMDYSPDVQKSIADALGNLAPGNPIIPAFEDYARMRTEARACLKSTSP